MTRLPLYLLLLILPLAVAGQNIGASIATLILLGQLFQKRKELSWRGLWSDFRIPLFLAVAFVGLLITSTMLNPDNPSEGAGALAWGHAMWALLPALVFLAQPPMTNGDWKKLFGFFGVVVAFMGAIALSQAVIGWKVSGSSFVSGDTRAQGFYSHPLTFAYVGLLLFPLGCIAVAKWSKSKAAWASFLGAAAIVYASQSRTAQAICAAIIGMNILYFAKGRARVALASVACASLLLVVFTDNPMKTRFSRTLSDKGFDVRSGYADDRLAFWDANWQMVKDRPILGHGDHLNTAYRAKYYERIGLGGFERMYEAHNMYLQVVVNAGVVGLGVFLAWYAWYLGLAARLIKQGFVGKVALQTLVALALGGVTQNAFQDSEVRFALTLFCVSLWLGYSSLIVEPSRPR